MSLNALALRLLDRDTIGETSVPGASYIPPAPASEEAVRDILGLTDNADTDRALLLLSAVRAFSWLYGMLGETHNTYEHLFAEQTLAADYSTLHTTLKNRASTISTVLSKAGLSTAFFLAESDMEAVAVVATALALANDDMRFV